VNYIEDKSKKPREKDSLLSDDCDILTLKECLKVAAVKAVKRASK
jgi:hypothetical protein